MKEDSKDSKLKLKKLQADFFKQLPGKMAALDKQWQLLKLHFDQIEFKDFHRAVHSLSGSAGTYGYFLLHQGIRDLEIYITQLLNYKKLTAIQQSDISHLLERLKDILKEETNNVVKYIEPPRKTVESRLILYLNSHEGTFETTLQKNLSDLGFKLIFLKTLPELQMLMNEHLPAVIIIDELFLSEEDIKELEPFRQYYQINLVCLAHHNDLQTRLKAIQAGATLFLQQPLDIFLLTNRLVQLCAMAAKGDYRVLVLDDSETLATYYALILEEAGMIVQKITKSSQLMPELQDFNPDVLLLDLYLPDCSGVDLAKMVRQEERYTSLPIIFISTEDDRYKQLSILKSCNGDDFLTKPVMPQNLIAAVKSRAQRSILLFSYITQDSMTNLLNHAFILNQLELELIRAHRDQTILSIGMIDLDHFKEVNDKYGHPIGDIILKKVAVFLSSMVRRTDFVGRYGGEEFIIILPNTNPQNAETLFNNIREAFSLFAFEVKEYQFNMTLSVGVASYPTHQTVNRIVGAADKALYQAKSQGRNKVIVCS